MFGIPNDAWRVVISYLPPYALYQLGLTSKKFKQISFESPLWKYFCKRDFGGYRHNPFETYLSCKKHEWRLIQKISGGDEINFLDFKDSEIISGTQPVKNQIFKFYSNYQHKSTLRLQNDQPLISLIRYNDLFISGTQQIDFWDLTGKSIHQLKNHTDSVGVLIQEKEKLISGSSDKTICIWDIETKISRTLFDFKSINCLSLMENDLISGGSGNTRNNLHLWDLRTPRCVASFDSQRFIRKAIQRMGNEILSDYGDVWDLRTFKLLHQYPENFDFYGFAPDAGKILGFFNHSFARYKNDRPKILFSTPNYLTCIKRLGDKLTVGSTNHRIPESIYVFEL